MTKNYSGTAKNKIRMYFGILKVKIIIWQLIFTTKNKDQGRSSRTIIFLIDLFWKKNYSKINFILIRYKSSRISKVLSFKPFLLQVLYILCINWPGLV